MALFGKCKTTVDCPKVKSVLLKVQDDPSNPCKMFKSLLHELELSWYFDRRKVQCFLEGSLEALLQAHTLFTAVQDAQHKTYTDINLLLTWCKQYCQVINTPVKDTNDDMKVKEESSVLLEKIEMPNVKAAMENLTCEESDLIKSKDVKIRLIEPIDLPCDHNNTYGDYTENILPKDTELNETIKLVEDIQEEARLPASSNKEMNVDMYSTGKTLKIMTNETEQCKKIATKCYVKSVSNYAPSKDKRQKCNIIKNSSMLSRYQQIKMAGKIKCVTCGKAFGQISTLRKHMNTHTKVKKFACEKCDKKFYLANHLRLHSQVHREKKVPPIKPAKPSIEETLGELAKHMAIYQKTSTGHIDTLSISGMNQEKELRVEYLPYDDKFLNVDSNIMNHPQESKTDQGTEASRHITKYSALITQKCQQPLRAEVANLMTRKELDSGLYLYKCKKCDYTSSCRESRTMREHIKRKHLELGAVYACNLCEKRYVIRKDLNRHVKTHMQSFTCTLCNKTYDYKTTLARHMLKTHSGRPQERPKCNKCGKDFCNSTALKYHIQRNHMGERKLYICEICGAALQTPASHKRHVELHTEGECKKQSHPCEICGIILGSKHALTYHVQGRHSEDRNFSCHVCGKSFKVKSVYRNHMKIHEERKMFDCVICDKSFLTKHSMTNHMLRHTGSKGRYPCEAKGCDKAFSDRKPLKKHMLKKHNMVLAPGKRGRPREVVDYATRAINKVEATEKYINNTSFATQPYNGTFNYRGPVSVKKIKVEDEVTKNDMAASNKEIESPVKYKIDDCMDTDATEISIDAEELDSGDIRLEIKGHKAFQVELL